MHLLVFCAQVYYHMKRRMNETQICDRKQLAILCFRTEKNLYIFTIFPICLFFKYVIGNIYFLVFHWSFYGMVIDYLENT